ncbi:MAG: DNA mismatch repair protein MutS, partial [Desulfobacterales bacterium]|nr:DNA mismatch repair protein MutS [Desulfobacterales bacterium]
MSPPKLTPMIKQYLSIKEEYPDTILFYRMGDFYEMFFEDAQVASRVLEITLTSRNKKDESPVPMCGVPHRAVSGYIARMIDHGYKVAVCDQIEDPATAKGLVKRDVVRVITPGMILDEAFLDKRSNNFVLAVARHGEVFGLSYLDISTGVFRLVESGDLAAMIDESLRISPREVLMPESAKTDPAMSTIREALAERSVTYLAESAFEHQRCYRRLTEQFKTISLEGFGCEGLPAGVRAAGALVFYVRETQKQKIELFTRLETYALDQYLL